MTTAAPTTTDVIIVGAGPTGLALAGELALAGVRCRILDRRADESNITRAFAVHARTLELLDGRGLAEDLVPRGVALREIQGLPGATLDMSELDSRYPMLLIAPQSATESVLGGRVERLGVPFVRGAEVVGLRQDGTGVDVDVADATGVHTERAAYVVGCDGAHSRVRELIGVPFTGTQYQTHIMLADAHLSEPPPGAMFGRNSDDGVAVVIPFGDGWFRVIVWDRRREGVPIDEPVTAGELRDGLRRIAGTDLGMAEPRWSSRFLSERRQAQRYRVGRVFLAGDAAHVHSPMGGQGMNTGIQDAMNLGWKLAAAVRGRDQGWLLDSYGEERHRVGEQVLALTDGFNRMVLSHSRIGIKLRQRVMRVVLGVGPTRRLMIGRLSGIGIRYPRRRGDHQLIGRRARDLATDGGRVYELLRTGRFVLIDRAGGSAARDAAAPWLDRLTVARRTTVGGPALMLVRPDGYVAWATDRPTDRTGLETALDHWCGPASGADRPADPAVRSARAHRARFGPDGDRRSPSRDSRAAQQRAGSAG
jgi:2-polyprenyl-6-methoxyphenol hydroxylase-like FAD-dependent oxidoreductase